MKTLHLFGDSFTQGHKLDDTFPPYKEWKNYRGGNLPECWTELLSEKLSMNMANYAVGGMSNSEIFHTICRYCDKFEKNDIVIINWTYPNRFRWVVWSEEEKRYRWRRLGASPMDGSIISEQTRNDIALNKILPPYIDEVYEYEKIIGEYSKSKDFKVLFWSADIDIINNLSSERLKNKKYLLHDQIEKLPLEITNPHIGIARLEMKRTIFDVFYQYGALTVGEETNGIVKDNHLGERGHVVQSELFYNYIVENNFI